MTDPLSHFDPGGAAHMVAVTDKPEVPRRAVARARIRVAPATFARISGGTGAKGDVLGVARLAAISGAKRTSDLIPLCHPVRLTGISVAFTLREDLPGVEVRVEVAAVDRTGPEMEAMTAAAAAMLTIYDMCKAMDRGMVIEAVELVEKSGGKSGQWTRGGG